MKRQLLLISNSTNPGEAYLDWCKGHIAEFLREREVKKVLFVPYAGVTISYDDYAARVAGVFATFGVEVFSIHTCAEPVQAVKEAACVVVGGGSTFHLVHELHRLKIMPILRERVLEGMPYMGWSAGSNTACPSMKTTNDMPIIEPESFNCLNVIPFQINPHYLDAHPAGHGGETREDRIKEFMVLNPDMYVAGLREATALLVIDDNMQLIGRAKPMRVFKQGCEAQEFEIGSDINFLLK